MAAPAFPIVGSRRAPLLFFRAFFSRAPRPARTVAHSSALRRCFVSLGNVVVPVPLKLRGVGREVRFWRNFGDSVGPRFFFNRRRGASPTELYLDDRSSRMDCCCFYRLVLRDARYVRNCDTAGTGNFSLTLSRRTYRRYIGALLLNVIASS